jgi:hypothetical protein
VIIGGLGVARAENPSGRFDLQAKACLVGFVVLVASLPFLGKSQEDVVMAEVIQSRERIVRMEASIARIEQAQNALEVKQRALADSLRRAAGGPPCNPRTASPTQPATARRR